MGKDEARKVTGGRRSTSARTTTLKVAKNLIIDAGDSVMIKTGDASITMKKDGTIVIKGKDITIEGSGKINVKASKDIVMKGIEDQAELSVALVPAGSRAALGLRRRFERHSNFVRISLIMDLIATAMVSSLGYDVRTACAAARAGLVRRTELPFTILENDSSPGLAVGHPAPLLGGGFEGDGRLIRLLEGAFRDLMAQQPIDSRSYPRLAFYLAIPRSDRERQGLDLIPDLDARARLPGTTAEATTCRRIARAAKILDTAVRLADFPIKVGTSVSTLRVAVSGHAAVIELYQRVAGRF